MVSISQVCGWSLCMCDVSAINKGTTLTKSLCGKAAQVDDVAERRVYPVFQRTGAIQIKTDLPALFVASSEIRRLLDDLTVLIFDIIILQKCLGKAKAEVPQTQTRYLAVCPAMSAFCGIVINYMWTPTVVSWLSYNLLSQRPPGYSKWLAHPELAYSSGNGTLR